MATRRARQAEATRRDIGVAARRLFAEHGYARTSVAAIAREAGVSVQTIYDSIGSKAAIVASLNDLIDDEGDVRTLAGTIPTTEDPVALLEVAVTISHNIGERCGDIIHALFHAAPTEPSLAAVRDESRRRHRLGIRGLVGRLDALGALRPGIPLDEAADVVAAMTDPQVSLTFVTDYGWSWERWHRWTLATLQELVLAPDAGAGA